MKAIVQDQYGAPDEVLHLRDIDQPIAGDDEVLVRVHAASVHADVWHVVTGRPWVLRLMGAGLRKPKNPVPGTDMAGVITAVGKNVTQFQPGDAVFGESIKATQWANGGAFAEYVCVAQDCLALKPDSISFEQAAAVPTSGLIALNNLQYPRSIQPGQKILINGAGGGVGAMALQIAKAHGAHVTGVDSANKLAMVRALGADHVIDYTQDDFAQQSERYDFIIDVASTLSFADCKRVLTAEGKYILIGHDHYGKSGGRVLGSLPHFFKLLAISPFVSHLPAMTFAVPSRKETMPVLKALLEAGKITPIIDKVFPLSEVREAMRYLQSGKACGKILLTP